MNFYRFTLKTLNLLFTIFYFWRRSRWLYYILLCADSTMYSCRSFITKSSMNFTTSAVGTRIFSQWCSDSKFNTPPFFFFCSIDNKIRFWKTYVGLMLLAANLRFTTNIFFISIIISSSLYERDRQHYRYKENALFLTCCVCTLIPYWLKWLKDQEIIYFAVIDGCR